jgi:hypothetical protein
VIKASIAIILFGLAQGCSSHDVVVERVDVGKTIDAKMVTRSWNERDCTQIVCDGGVFLTVGLHSVLTGRKATLVEYKGGEKYLFIEGSGSGIRVYD